MPMSLVYRMVDGVLQSEAAEPSRPGPDEVLVEVEASSLNYRDIAIRAGSYPSRSGVIPLSDGAGKIVEVGAAVSDLKTGQQVTSCFYPFWESYSLRFVAAGRVRAGRPCKRRQNYLEMLAGNSRMEN